jgi:hypothetical protein
MPDLHQKLSALLNRYDRDKERNLTEADAMQDEFCWWPLADRPCDSNTGSKRDPTRGDLGVRTPPKNRKKSCF